jgi:hypothetical protein
VFSAKWAIYTYVKLPFDYYGHLTGVIEVVVPISKCHHEQIPLVENTLWLMSAVKPETAMPNKIVNQFTFYGMW